MTISRLRALAAVAVASSVAFLAACGSDSNGGPTFSDSLSTVEADSVAGGLSSYASQVAEGMNFNGPSIGLAAPAMYSRIMAKPGMSLSTVDSRVPKFTPDFSALRTLVRGGRYQVPSFVTAEGCTFSGHGQDDFPYGNPIDVNQNGIPDDFAIRIECQLTDSTSDPDTTVTQYVLEEIAAKEIPGSLWGVQVNEEIHVRVSNNFGQVFIEEAIKASGKTDIRSGGVSDAADLTVSLSAKPDSVLHALTYGESFDNSFDPVTSIALGDPLPNGALTISGRQYHTDTDGHNIQFGIRTTSPLSYSAACYAADTNPPFTAGALRGMLNNNANQASFTISFTSCGNATVTIDGAHDPSA